MNTRKTRKKRSFGKRRWLPPLQMDTFFVGLNRIWTDRFMDVKRLKYGELLCVQEGTRRKKTCGAYGTLPSITETRKQDVHWRILLLR